jgi:hypothetical protein
VRVAPNYETEEGARGSDAARQSNCQRTAKAHAPSHIEEKSAKNLWSTDRNLMVGSKGKKFAFADFEPIRTFARRTERSLDDVASFEGQRSPLSRANFESGLLAVAQFRHGSAKLCPAAISHSTGNNETNATFTRSITALTNHRSHRSFRTLRDRSSFAPQLFHGDSRLCHYKSPLHLYVLRFCPHADSGDRFLPLLPD